MKKLWKYCVLLFLLSGCLPKEICPDEIDPDFPADNLEWFSYEVGDTLFFRNPLNEDTFHLVCHNKESGLDSSFNNDFQCENDGWYIIHPYISHEFISNFPHLENKDLKFIFEMSGSPNSILDIYFGDTFLETRYVYTFRFTPEGSEIVRYPFAELISFKNSVMINNIEYENVYIIANYLPSGTELDVFYDTIYYNKDGFLKFISSEYGYRLERLP